MRSRLVKYSRDLYMMARRFGFDSLIIQNSLQLVQ